MTRLPSPTLLSQPSHQRPSTPSNRTTDLFSDPTASQQAKLLLEKNTHLALRIQLDPAAGRIKVNDEAIDLAASDDDDDDDGGRARVAVMKADVSLGAASLPTSLFPSFARLDGFSSCVSAMRPEAVDGAAISDGVVPVPDRGGAGGADWTSMFSSSFSHFSDLCTSR